MTKRVQVFRSPDITVTFDPNVCSHSGVCLRGLPAVFDVSRSDWVRPNEASAPEVAAVVARCPSGALQAVRPGVPPARPSGGTEVTIQVEAHGPVRVNGPVALELQDGSRSERDGAFALCRCGHSGNPPYCDGSHGPARFRG